MPDSLRRSDYGRAIQEHIAVHQLEEGDSIVSFDCVTDRGEPFDRSLSKGRHVLPLYGGLDCMSASGRIT